MWRCPINWLVHSHYSIAPFDFKMLPTMSPTNSFETESRSFEEKKGWRVNIAMFISLFVIAIACIRLIVKSTFDNITEVIDPVPREILIFGDSLIHPGVEPTILFDLDMIPNLQKSVNKAFPQYIVKVSSSGVNGQGISALRDRLDRDVLERNGAGPPDAVIMYWDSDENERRYTESTYTMRVDVLANYSNDLKNVLSKLKKHINHVAVASPGLSGEHPRGRNSRDNIYEYYAKINLNITAMCEVDYIDVRTMMSEHVPWYWIFQRWSITQDGEHMNSRGEKFIIRMFTEQISRWQDLWKPRNSRDQH